MRVRRVAVRAMRMVGMMRVVWVMPMTIAVAIAVTVAVAIADEHVAIVRQR